MWSADHADDVFQEIYIALFKARDRYDPEKNTWLNYAFMTARHTVQDFFRGKQLIGMEWGRDAEPAMMNAIDEYDAVTRMDTPLLWELETYTLKEQRVLLLIIAGYSQREIASYLSTGEAYVSKIIARLRIRSTPLSSSLHTDSLPLRRAA
jgi:RNA polymerase sigma factor (sigma-70 family)